MELKDRFLKYVSFDTQSDESSETFPSTAKQRVLLDYLAEEMKALGLTEVTVDKYGYAMGTIPATPGCEKAPVIGFIAHVDTAPDMSGADVKPHVIENYDGKDIRLNAGVTMKVADFPELSFFKGHTLIHTDGTTLLGADDKAGIAEIMQMVAWIKTHPEVPHARLCIGFTPDEEVARGTENFDIPLFGAAYAYTFDGGEIGTLESENFNAGTALVTIRGVGVHPGLSKGKMVNSVRYAARLIDRLPIDQAPETTEGHEGFLHPNMAKGTVVESVVRILVRDHDRALYEEKKAFLVKLVDEMSAEFPEAKFSLEIKDSYENMKPYLDKAPKVLEIVRAAYRACGMEPQEEPIRGGTDGARLSVRGLPCPNVFTGGMNFHGVYECIPVKSLDKGAEVAVMLAKKSAEVTSLQ